MLPRSRVMAVKSARLARLTPAVIPQSKWPIYKLINSLGLLPSIVVKKIRWYYSITMGQDLQDTHENHRVTTVIGDSNNN